MDLDCDVDQSSIVDLGCVMVPGCEYIVSNNLNHTECVFMDPGCIMDPGRTFMKSGRVMYPGCK